MGLRNALWHGMHALEVKLITSQLCRHPVKQNRTARTISWGRVYRYKMDCSLLFSTLPSAGGRPTSHAGVLDTCLETALFVDQVLSSPRPQLYSRKIKK